MKLLATLFLLILLPNLADAQSRNTKFSPDRGDDIVAYGRQLYMASLGEDFFQKKTNARNDESKLDSAIYWSWNEPESAWAFSNKEIYAYHGTYDVIINLDEFYENEYRDSIFYDSSGRIIRIVTQSWTGSAWETSYVIVRTYNDDGNLLESTFLLDDGGQLVNDFRTVYTYDGNGFLVEQGQFVWSDAWENLSRSLFENNSEGLPVVVTAQNWDEEAWLNSRRYTYEYGSHDEVLNEQEDYWYGDWVLTYNTTNTYTDQQLLSETLTGYYIAGILYSSTRVLFTYDAAGNLTSELYEKEELGEWVNTSQYLTTYDENNNAISWLAQYWEDAWINNDSAYYYYNTISATSEPFGQFGITVYPNPVTDVLHLKMEETLKAQLVNIYNLSGQLVQSVLPASGTKLDVSQLPRGSYLLELRTQNSKARSLFVKL